MFDGNTRYFYIGVANISTFQFLHFLVNLLELRRLYSTGVTRIFILLQLPIIEYLEETRPENKLLPDDPVKRAQVIITCIGKLVIKAIMRCM